MADQHGARLKIEPDPDTRSFRCPSCGADSTRVLGYVTDHDSPLAVYHADLYSNHTHPHAAVVLTISLGDWGADAPSSSRRRARIEVTPKGDQVLMSFTDFAPNEDLKELLGRPLRGDEARRSADRAAYLLVADAVVYGDNRVAETLGISEKLS